MKRHVRIKKRPKECVIVDENVSGTSRMTMANRAKGMKVVMFKIGTGPDLKEKNSLNLQEYMFVHPPLC